MLELSPRFTAFVWSTFKRRFAKLHKYIHLTLCDVTEGTCSLYQRTVWRVQRSFSFRRIETTILASWLLKQRAKYAVWDKAETQTRQMSGLDVNTQKYGKQDTMCRPRCAASMKCDAGTHWSTELLDVFHLYLVALRSAACALVYCPRTSRDRFTTCHIPGMCGRAGGR